MYYQKNNEKVKVITYYKLIKRNIVHKFWVAYYCFQIGLFWQGITHDLSKFSWLEFSRSIKYWNDKISSLENERKINGYSETFLHHRGRNPHHYEYWIHSLDKGGIPAKMPRKYALELICDYLGACKSYGHNPKTEYEWWMKYNSGMKIHPDTKKYITCVFSFFRTHSLRESIKHADELCN